MTGKPDREAMDREEIEQLQLERLEATLNRAQRSVPFYRRRFAEAGFDAEGLRSLDDLRRLPFTTKRDLRDNHPYGMFAVPLRDVVRVHASSGTTGLATAVGYTRNDLRPGPTWWPGCWWPAGWARTTWCRWPSTTASSPAPSASTRGRSGWARR